MARILCVDDQVTLVKLQRAILENEGHVVSVVNSVRKALARLQTECYDAVITGWRLFDGNGRAVIQAARNSSDAPVVVVLATVITEAFDAAEPYADIYLERPVNPEELIIIVEELLKQPAKPAGAVTGRTDHDFE